MKPLRRGARTTVRGVSTIAKDFGRLGQMVRRQGLGLTTLAGLDKGYRLITGGPWGRFSRVGPHVVVGGQVASRGWERLFKAGVRGVINMRDEYDYGPKVKARFGDIQLLYLPTRDNEAPTIEDLTEGTDFTRDVVANGGRVYIHCWEGLGRGPTMAAAYFVSTGMTPEEAWTHLRRYRPFIRPTEPQIKRLHRFAEVYGQPGPVITPTGLPEAPVDVDASPEVRPEPGLEDAPVPPPPPENL